jgi:hypothetical protein
VELLLQGSSFVEVLGYAAALTQYLPQISQIPRIIGLRHLLNPKFTVKRFRSNMSSMGSNPPTETLVIMSLITGELDDQV